MKKFRFRIRNYLLMAGFLSGYRRNKQEYPEIINFLNQKYGSPVFIDEFNNLDNWKITDKNEWGSAREDNLCTYEKENVTLREEDGKRFMVISSTPKEATGHDWEGNEVTKPTSSGFVSSKFLFHPGQVVSATLDTSRSYPGSWFAFWLIKKEEAGDERYREVDIFEKFMEKKNQKKYTITVHGGTPDKREMMNFRYPMSHVDESKITFTCELYADKVRVFVNGLMLFTADEPDFDGEYYVVFDDAPTTHGDKVTRDEILKALPRSLEIHDFRVYKV